MRFPSSLSPFSSSDVSGSGVRGGWRVPLWRIERTRNKNIEEANEVLARFVPRQRGRSSRETQHAPYFAREREQRLAFFLEGREGEIATGSLPAIPLPFFPERAHFDLSAVREFLENSCSPRIQRSCPRCYSGRPRPGIRSPNDDVTGARLFPSPDSYHRLVLFSSRSVRNEKRGEAASTHHRRTYTGASNRP